MIKLRNKKTGEVVVFGEGVVDLRKIGCKNMAEMIEAGWEDYEEPKEYWCIDWTGGINKITSLDGSHDKYEQNKKEIGNYFETKEEAEKAVEKLKAWKRLKDKGFEIKLAQDGGYGYLRADWGLLQDDFSDVKLLFGGEE